MTTDHNLLFGVLAFQLNFIDRRALLAAFDQWKADKNTPLGEILVELGNLDMSRRALLDALSGTKILTGQDQTVPSPGVGANHLSSGFVRS